ncbi:hypothetical protein GCM10027262_40040 [Nocardia tengchongensis]
MRRECAKTAEELGANYGIWAGFNLATSPGQRGLRKLLGVEKPSTVRHCACGRQIASQYANAVMCTPCAQGLRDIAPVRAHLKQLLETMSQTEIAARAQISPGAVNKMLSADRPYVKGKIADRLFAIKPDAVAEAGAI